SSPQSVRLRVVGASVVAVLILAFGLVTLVGRPFDFAWTSAVLLVLTLAVEFSWISWRNDGQPAFGVLAGVIVVGLSVATLAAVWLVPLAWYSLLAVLAALVFLTPVRGGVAAGAYMLL